MKYLLALIVRVKRVFCKHEFNIYDSPGRDAEGMLDWPCYRCGKIFRVPYGLALPGQLIQDKTTGGAK